MNLIENSMPLEIRLKISSTITCASFFFAFFLSKSIWLNLTISLCIGSGYYWLINAYPQFIPLIIMIVNYYLKNLYKKWSSIILNKQKIKNINCLVVQDNSYLMIYEDVGHPTDGTRYNKQYIFKFNEKHRSNDLIIFKDEKDHDITDFIEPYLGPLQNFHGVSYTPADFNHKVIKVFRDGNEISYFKTFQEHDVLKLD
jgi:hypothetical protein